MKKLLIFILFTSIWGHAYANFEEKIAALEASSGGHIGLLAVNTADNTMLSYRAHERFPMGSTFKLMGVAAVLKESMRNPAILDEKIYYKKEDLDSWSPVTQKHIQEGMRVSDLCAAAIMESDTTAINLLMKQLGGAEKVIAFARSIGDDAFTFEGELVNGSRYITTPFAMGKSLQTLTLGNVLNKTQREQLITWLKGTSTGNNRIRAGVPQGWIVGDKTGSGDYGITNDIAIIWPPQRPPIILTVYYNHPKVDAMRRPDIVAAATRIVIDELIKTK